MEEHTGFQSGGRYGDGDEVREVKLSSGQQVELVFQAKVYGAPRAEDVARFRIYGEGELVEQKELRLHLKPDFAEVSTVLAPMAVRKGATFVVGVPVFYSFGYDTSITLVLKIR